jgi:hypothetical protein
MGLKLGVNSKAYFLSTGTRASWGGSLTNGEQVSTAPSNLTEISILKDVKVPQEKEKADVTTRRTRFKATKGTLIGVETDLPVIKDKTDAAYIALKKAFLTDTPIAIAILDDDKATSGTTGFWADWEVTKMEDEQMLAAVQETTFSITPAYSAVPPENVKVT